MSNPVSTPDDSFNLNPLPLTGQDTQLRLSDFKITCDVFDDGDEGGNLNTNFRLVFKEPLEEFADAEILRNSLIKTSTLATTLEQYRTGIARQAEAMSADNPVKGVLNQIAGHLELFLE